jgi:plasmid rolling circle replication initiator protein Rep
MHQHIITSDVCQPQDPVWLAGSLKLHSEEAKRKIFAEILSHIYELSPSLREYAWKLRICGDQLAFGINEEGVRRLMAANYCLERLCPQCMHRRTVRTYAQITRVLDWLDKQCDIADQAHFRYVLLTLTVKNCPGPDLKSTIDHLMHSWSKLRRLEPFMKSVKGYFRALEITHNEERGDYHPHFHVMMAVRPSYFSRNYIKHDQWVQMWREAAKLDYDPQVDVQAVKPGDGQRGAVAEIVKYTVKGSDYIYPDLEKAVPVVETLRMAMFGRRLFFYGGIFAEARHALKLGDADFDLTDADEVRLRRECIVAIEKFHWVHGTNDWVLRECGPAPKSEEMPPKKKKPVPAEQINLVDYAKRILGQQ